MDPEECEYLAEEELITIVPNFSSNEPEEFFFGIVGPFEAGIPAEVPLWMALFLKRKHKCTIAPPAWLTVDELRKASAAESSSQTFTKIHPHFFEISRILISKVAHDLTEHDQMMPLVRDIWDKRMSKLRTSTAKFLEQAQQNHARMSNITKLECCYARAFMGEVTHNVDTLVQYSHRFAPENS